VGGRYSEYCLGVVKRDEGSKEKGWQGHRGKKVKKGISGCCSWEPGSQMKRGGREKALSVTR
jgi:hypothetical protein